MPKRKTPGRMSPAPAGRTRRPAAVRPALLAALLLAAVAALALSPAPKGGGVTPSAAAQATPLPLAKEYVYAGGRLVATEEPAAAQATPTPTPTPAPTPTPTPPPSGQEAVFWTNMVGVSASPTANSLTKTAGGLWDAGAVSTRGIASGDGYVEFTADSYAARMCGLSNGDSNQSFADIDFAIHPNGGGMIDIWEKGVFVSGGVHSYQPGDRFRVSVEAGFAKYYKISGGTTTLIYEHQATIAYPLQVDTSLYSMVTGVSNVVLGGNVQDLPPPAQDIVWTNAVGVTVSGNSLTKTAAANWTNAGASSTRAIASGEGYAEFTAGTQSARMFGLSRGDTDQSFASIDYAVHPNGGGLVDIWERGVFVAGGVHSYLPGDRFRVAIEGQGSTKYVRYYRIRAGVMTLVHEHQTTPVYPLFADTSLYSTGSTVEGAVISGTLSP